MVVVLLEVRVPVPVLVLVRTATERATVKVRVLIVPNSLPARGKKVVVEKAKGVIRAVLRWG